MHLKIQASIFLVHGSKIVFVENEEPFFQQKSLLYAIALINPLPSACFPCYRLETVLIPICNRHPKNFNCFVELLLMILFLFSLVFGFSPLILYLEGFRWVKPPIPCVRCLAEGSSRPGSRADTHLLLFQQGTHRKVT